MSFDPQKDWADVAVIGGGGAGLMAGIAAAKAGARTVVYERMKTPGRKVAISGGGRCNFTNTLDPRQFVRLFGDKNSSHLGHALRAFSGQQVIDLLAAHGVTGQLERGYRLYTRSGRGMDVVEAFKAELSQAGGVLVTGARITDVAVENREGRRGYVLTGEFGTGTERRHARTVVICTGGLSYPATGSTGDGYAWARQFGHAVTPLRPALVGLTTEESWPRAIQGLSWDDARVSLWEAAQAPGLPARKKPFGEERGEILFTHFGISGPAVIDLSNVFVRCGLQRARMTVDYFPDATRDELDARLLAQFKTFPNRTPARALEGLLPGRLLAELEKMQQPDAVLPAGQVSRTARLEWLDRLKATPLTITGTRGMEWGEVTAGGIDWKTINPATLESKLSPGLFFAGEILDVAGRCGGFNLQAAFSTGYLAGRSAAQL